MNLKIFDLRCFVALCKYRNFTKAAQEMYISQPPFSRIIKKLEFEMRGILVERSKNTFSLTQLGESFLKVAQETIKSYENSMRTMELIRKPQSDELQIGYTYFSSQLPGFYEILDNFSLSGAVSLEEVHTQELLEKLTTGNIDIGLFHFPLSSNLFKQIKISQCNTAVLFPQQICCFREQRSYDIVLNEDIFERTYNEYILKNFQAYNLSPLYKRTSQLSSQIAASGCGSVLIYPEPVAQSINRGRKFTLEIIENSDKVFGLYATTLKNPIKNLTEKAFAHL